ncbi:MAG: CHAT domain-containing protein [Elainellaceae cyanobacterium]
MRSHRLLGLVTSTVLLSLVVPVSLSLSFRESAALAQEAGEGDRQAEADALYQEALQAWQQSQYSQALETLQQALEIYREIGDRAGEGRALGNLGLAYFSLGDYQQGINFFEQSLAIAQEIGDRQMEGTALGNLGNAYRDLGDYRQAIDFYEQNLAITREIGNRAGERSALFALGWSYNFQAQYQLALDFFSQALTISQDIGDLTAEAGALYALGWTHDDLGQRYEAIELYQQALALAREDQNFSQEAHILNGFGWVYTSLEEYQTATSFFQKQLRLARDIGDRRHEANALNGLGFVHSRIGDYEQAIQYSSEALTIQREIGDLREQAYSLGDLGNIYAALEDYQKANEYLVHCLLIQRELGNRWGEAITLSDIGKIMGNQNESELAIVYFKESVRRWEEIRSDIQGLPIDKQESFVATVSQTYRRLADLLLQENRVLEAQQVLDLLKVQELDEYLHNVRGPGQDLTILRPEQTILDTYGELQKSAIEIGQELAQLQQKASQGQLTPQETERRSQLIAVQQDLNQEFNTFARREDVRELVNQLSFEAQEQVVSLGRLDALRDKLRQLDAVMLYPLILEDRLELIITTPDSPPLRRTVENLSQAELNRVIVEFRQALQSPRSNAEAPAQQLYEWLIAPIEADLAQANPQTIIYAPDGALRYISLAALHDGNQWLAERYQVNNITAASIEELVTEPQDAPRVLAAAFADVSQTYSVEVGDRTIPFSGLPFAGTEVERLTSTLSDIVTFVDDGFSKAAIESELGNYNIIHFATHAAFVPGDPSQSFILFGNGDRPTLRDVETWSLNTVDLVVLSACETGLGGFDNNGEQILGLGYVFQNRGARAVLASLWQVNDEGTQVLMNAFYEYLQQGMSKAEALQAAQQALISNSSTAQESDRGIGIELIEGEQRGESQKGDRSLSHPHYWAPFILIGNGL